MKISIITPSFNSEKTIGDTIKSVVGQTYKDIEYIIVDGGSKDKTLKIVNKYKDKISKIVSEPDRGIFDAMNKGIDLAEGDIVGILNSDDFYADNDIIEKVVECFQKNDIDSCYGDIIYIDKDDISKKVRYWKAGEYKEKKLNNGWIPPHPAFFVKREVYQKYGKFRLDFHIAADYELMFRFLKIYKISTFYLPKVLVFMRTGGNSARDLKQRVKGWQELKRAWIVNNLKPPNFFILKRIFFKLPQFFFKAQNLFIL